MLAAGAHVSRRGLLLGAGGTALVAGCRKAASAAPSRLTVRDQRGKKITLSRPAQRVVTIVIPAASMLIAVDGGVDHLVGMNSSSAQAVDEGILGEIFPQAKKINSDVADASFAPNVESILGLNPDLVIQWGDRGAGITAPLENAGLTVAGLHYGTQDDLEFWITMFGELLGKADRASSMVKRMRQRRAEIEKAARGTSGKPKILYFQAFSDGLTVGGAGTYNDFYINLVGGRNAAASVTGAKSVDPEQVLAWNPDIVLVGNFDSATPQDVYRNKIWTDLSAVRSRRVYKIPLGGYRWDPPSQESALMWRWLSMIARPNDTTDLRSQIAAEFRLLYDYRPSDRQLDQILWTDLNSNSANYARFHAR